MDQSSTLTGRGRNKVFWSEEEVQILIQVLQELACDPKWKTDGGFKANYMVEVHRRIVAKLPQFQKQVTPHIESKIKWLKTKFHIINDMCRESGCTWNDVDKKIECERQWFDNYKQTHKEARGMWNFQFPYMNQLELVYGRDRATGAVVESFGDAIRNMEICPTQEDGGASNAMSLSSSSDEEAGNEEDTSSRATPSSTNTNASKRSSKMKQPMQAKRRKSTTQDDRESQMDKLNMQFQEFVEGFNKNLEKLSNAIAEESKVFVAESTRTRDVVPELIKLQLPSGDIFKAANILGKDKEKIEVFYGLPAEMRRHYVMSLLL